MPAPKGNQFAKGNKGGGRKGFEYEAKQIKKMRGLFNRALILAGKIQVGKATDREKESHQLLLKLILKIMDKLHATKQETEIKIEEKILIDLGDGKSKES